MEEIRLSIRRLSEFLLRSGSLDNRWGGAERAQLGSRIHRRLQKEGGESYQAEVSLSRCVEAGGLLYRLEGRADGIVETPEGFLIDEIKTTAMPLEAIGENFSRAHWGQAMCYGWIWAWEQDVQSIDVRLTYFHIDTQETKRFLRRFSREELDHFIQELLGEYERWARFSREWGEARTASLNRLAFPFPSYRKGQREMAAAVYRTIAAQGRLFCQAPTGIGKTLSALFPSLKAMGQGMGEKLFYLTARTTARQAAVQALEQMGRAQENRGEPLRLKSVVLTAKDKICFLEQRDCNPEKCPYAEGYYDRANEALYTLLTREDRIGRETLEEYGRRFRVCPFELGLDATQWCDCIICDYNYLFDPTVNLRRFFESRGDYIFLIDEAHNLVDRSREMYSAQVRKSDFLELRREASGQDKALASALGRVSKVLLAVGKLAPQEAREGEPFRLEKPPETLVDALEQFSAFCGQWLEDRRRAGGSPFSEKLLPLYFNASFFIRICSLAGEGFTVLVTSGKRETVVRLLCLDPAPFLDASMKKGRAAILFSATLSPAEYYISILGGNGREQPSSQESSPEKEPAEKEARSKKPPLQPVKKYALPSPFPRENLLILAARVSIRYKDRRESLLPVSRLLAGLTEGKPGNYMAFFPSYRYMEQVLDVLRQEHPEIPLLVQEQQLDEPGRETFLSQFTLNPKGNLLGCCVLGGVFSEGVDLPGDRLSGAAIVGVGLPQISCELDALRDYYESKAGQGYDFAYRYPGMNKVLQAAGRVIRSQEDRGVVLLIDDRFSLPSYRRLFPEHWEECRFLGSGDRLPLLLQHFWKGEPGGE